jgi:hypothetical protein
MEYFAWFEATGFSVWMRESGFAFFSSLILHALGMAFIVGVHLATDLRVLGFAPGVPLAQMLRFRPVGRMALVVVTVSGVLLLAAYPTKALTNPVFYLKLGAVIAALVVGRALSKGFLRRADLDGAAVPGPVRAQAALSVVLWTTAITAGRFLAYTYDVLLASHVS